MIRVLFIILAVVSMVLAFVLSISWLYLVSAGILVAAAVILTVDTRKLIKRSKVAGSRPDPNPAPPKSRTDDLKSLGIMEIRPKKVRSQTEGATPETAPAEEAAEADDGDDVAISPRPAARDSDADSEQGGTKPDLPPEKATTAPAPPAPQPTASPSGPPRVGVVRKRARTAKIMVEGVSEELKGEVVLSTLRALRAAVDATTIALLREQEGPLGYSVEAIVSGNSFARSGGHFTVGAPLVASSGVLVPVVLSCMGAEGFNARRLGYYHEPIAIHKVAFVPLTIQSPGYLLVADSMEDEAFEEVQAAQMLREFGRLVRHLVAAPSGHDQRTDGQVGRLRPRREIIAEEMDAAREASRPLSLTLVHLHRGEGSSGSDVVSSEMALENRLASSAAGGRVERFGELTFGVLQTRGIEEVEQWASRVHRSLQAEEGALGGDISIGVAMLDERHDSPDALRSDATAALRESYETGECIILE